MLLAAVVLAVAFVVWERRAAHPLLDVRLFRLPQFTVPNFVAFCTYLATFAIFFFTALYLVEVVSDSGYKIALVFAPMTVLMIVGSVLAGYWTGRHGPRWPITVGCAAFAAGLLIANPLISAHPNYVALSLALALAGIGIGITVVPVTTAVLERGAAGAVGDGRLGRQHQPGDRRGGRHLGARRAGLLPAQLEPRSHIDACTSRSEQGRDHGASSRSSSRSWRPGRSTVPRPVRKVQGGLIAQVERRGDAAFGGGLHAAFYLSAGCTCRGPGRRFALGGPRSW